MVFIYDILIYSQSEMDHTRDLKGVLRKLRENQLYVDVVKISFR